MRPHVDVMQSLDPIGAKEPCHGVALLQREGDDGTDVHEGVRRASIYDEAPRILLHLYWR
jgi:hypothetical protein